MMTETKYKQSRSDDTLLTASFNLRNRNRGGSTGLPRLLRFRSVTAVRNDGAACLTRGHAPLSDGHHLFQSFELWKRLAKNPVNPENLDKIQVQTKFTKNRCLSVAEGTTTIANNINPR